MTKLISWNVNGIRACVGKGFVEFFKKVEADVFCIQETKLQEGQLKLEFENYFQYWNYATKKGYSGTAVFTRVEPLNVTKGIGIPEHDDEGRVLTLEFKDYFLVNIYTPNAQRGLARLAYRILWEEAFKNYVNQLDNLKPVVVCGDLNVAHKEIDLKNPSSNHGSAGFSDEERQKFSEFLEAGFIDTFRFFYPDKKDSYTWWSYMFGAREKNVGWRIDYFCVSKRLTNNLIDAYIHNDIFGSDHCPIELLIK